MLPFLVLLGYVQWTHPRFLDNKWLEVVGVAECQHPSYHPLNVFLTISPFATVTNEGHIHRQIQLNWYGGKPKPGDQVALYSQDPRRHPKLLPQWLVSVDGVPAGSSTTTIYFPESQFTNRNPNVTLKSECLNQWIAYLSGEQKIIRSSCFKTQPNWMMENRRFLENYRMDQIFIPGTHDSGSYKPYLGEASEQLIIKYLITQDEDIYSQLVYGIRYLDLRIGHFAGTKEKFWINHNFFRTNNSLPTVFRDVKLFLDQTKEFLILDFHRFPVGFDGRGDRVHKELIQTIINWFSDYMIPQNRKNSTLKKLWEEGKRLIVAYNSHAYTLKHPLLWPGVYQSWGDKQDVNSLKNYFQQVFEEREAPSKLWAAMSQLTPTTTTIVLQPQKGLRGMAVEVNLNMTHWFRFKWWEKANIVAADYFLGTDIVNVAINANRKRIICSA